MSYCGLLCTVPAFSFKMDTFAKIAKRINFDFNVFFIHLSTPKDEDFENHPQKCQNYGSEVCHFLWFLLKFEKLLNKINRLTECFGF